MTLRTVVKSQHDWKAAPNLLDYQKERAAFSWEEARRGLAEANNQFTIGPTYPQDMALLHFTSGATGSPKGAIHVHEAVVVHHITGKLALDFLPRERCLLVQRARAGSLRSSELSDPTITVTNLGELGVEAVLGPIYPPRVALVGFGKIVERPWSVDGQIVPRPLVTATLAADHRAMDGFRTEISKRAAQYETATILEH